MTTRAPWTELTIVTTCKGYGKYLPEWAQSLVASTVYPSRAVIVVVGDAVYDRMQAERAARKLTLAGIACEHIVIDDTDFGTARNVAVGKATTEWVMHFDCDDTLLPDGLAQCQALSDGADVISAGYVRTGTGRNERDRVYANADGLAALDLHALCSGVSPFRKRLWEQVPYRTDMLGAWDTALWLGFARLGARFRATSRAVFQYRLHADSVYNTRRTVLGWARVKTQAQLKALRRAYHGVDIIVPRDLRASSTRERAWQFVSAWYQQHHGALPIEQGVCPTVTWCKGAAVANALARSNAEVIVIADADCVVSPTLLNECIENVRSGAVAWAVPHTLVARLSEQSTRDTYARGTFDEATMTLERPWYAGVLGGGVVVCRRVDYDAVGGIPLAFKGWGSEDKALGLLLDKLVGPALRLSGMLYHMYHDINQSGKARQTMNVQLLQRLGVAAQKGADELVRAVHTLPRQEGGTLRSTDGPSAQRTLPAIDTQAIQARRDAQSRRRAL